MRAQLISIPQKSRSKKLPSVFRSTSLLVFVNGRNFGLLLCGTNSDAFTQDSNPVLEVSKPGMEDSNSGLEVSNPGLDVEELEPFAENWFGVQDDAFGLSVILFNELVTVLAIEFVVVAAFDGVEIW